MQEMVDGTAPSRACRSMREECSGLAALMELQITVSLLITIMIHRDG